MAQGPPSRLPGEPEPARQSEPVVVEGIVVESLPNDMYAVELSRGQRILGHIAASTRVRLVRIVPGDRVTIELSPYDLSRGRIVRRHR